MAKGLSEDGTVEIFVVNSVVCSGWRNNSRSFVFDVLSSLVVKKLFASQMWRHKLTDRRTLFGGLALGRITLIRKRKSAFTPLRARDIRQNRALVHTAVDGSTHFPRGLPKPLSLFVHRAGLVSMNSSFVAAQIEERFIIARVRLVNDFVAAGYGLLTLDIDTECATVQVGSGVQYDRSPFLGTLFTSLPLYVVVCTCTVHTGGGQQRLCTRFEKSPLLCIAPTSSIAPLSTPLLEGRRAKAGGTDRVHRLRYRTGRDVLDLPSWR